MSSPADATQHRCAPPRAPRTWHRIMAAALAFAALALAGCSSLPAARPRPVSSALPAADTTPLDRAVTPAAPGLSGLRLLADGDHALDARLALIRRAQRSLDLQYYLIGSDEVGFQVLRELRDAAARGVRVRLLVDDLYTTGQDDLFAGLAAHEGVEVRLFNPLPARSGGFGMRLLRSMHEFGRINHRMHNKLFIADGAFAVAGGRNLANEYFTRSQSANFIDMDVLATGAVVGDLAATFDAYWNSEQAWSVQELVDTDPVAARAAFDALVASAPADATVTARDRFGRTSVRSQLDAGHLDQEFAAVRVLADSPAKAAGGMAADRTTMGQAVAAMSGARSELLIVSPYFVPGDDGMALLRDAADKQVHLTVMTNSLGATDVPVVHQGYARYRKAMLKMGVEVRELGSTLSRNAGIFGDFRSSLGRLHAKVTVIDRRQLLVGSMNMDGRSRHHNTEMALLIDSAPLAEALTSLFDSYGGASSYRLRLATNERIEWLSTEDNREVVRHDEPESSWGLRVRTSLTAAFLSEDLL